MIMAKSWVPLMCFLGSKLLHSHGKVPEITSDNRAHSMSSINLAATSSYHQYPETSFLDNLYVPESSNNRNLNSIFQVEKILNKNPVKEEEG
jgi:hypothetical protein